MSNHCTVLFCALDKHEGDLHVDVTGHSWHELTPGKEVIAHVYTPVDYETKSIILAELHNLATD